MEMLRNFQNKNSTSTLRLATIDPTLALREFFLSSQTQDPIDVAMKSNNFKEYSISFAMYYFTSTFLVQNDGSLGNSQSEWNIDYCLVIRICAYLL